GSRARRLGSATTVLRTRADALALIGSIEALDRGSRVVVVGGGFVGAEVATSLVARGLAPVVLETLARPLITVLGGEVSAWLAPLGERAGVDVRSDQRVLGATVNGGSVRVDVGPGGELVAPIALAAVGAAPNVEWLEGSGLDLDRGVVVDEALMASECVAAIGDVARASWRGPLGVEQVRVEHWQSATDHALALARRWTGGAPVAAVPYFWSDQYGHKIQVLGHPHADDDVTRVAHDAATERFTALYSRDGVVTGAVALSQPRTLMRAKAVLDEPTTLDDALARAPWAD
ncbi:MAG: FAD-dependent oxidoreductase, partial [Acidimicrobiales bacterium]